MQKPIDEPETLNDAELPGDTPAEFGDDTQREELVNKRRNRAGKGVKLTKPKMLALGLLATASALYFFAPGSLTSADGDGNPNDGSKTSVVDLEVKEKKVDDAVRLDFGNVPPVDNSGKDQALLDRIAQLEQTIDENAESSPEDEMQALIERIVQENATKLDEAIKAERARADEEIAKLKQKMTEAEAKAISDRAEEEARRIQELYASQNLEAITEEQQAKKDELETTQRKSPSVVLDGGITAEAGADGTVSANSEMTNDQRYLAAAADEKVKTAISKPLSDPSSTVLQGTIISAVLETAIDTQLPGHIRAQVTEPVFSYDGSRILMPAGTVVIGQFSTDIKTAQQRVLIAWTRAVTPDGNTIALGSTGTDTLGRSGTGGNVDNRIALKLAASAAITLVTAAPAVIKELTGLNSAKRHTNPARTLLPDGTLAVHIPAGTGLGVNLNADAALEPDAAFDAANDFTGQAGSILEEYLNLPPVIRVPQGEEIRIFVNRDLLFK